MKTYIQSGDTIDVTAATNITAGQIVIVGGAMQGVATTSAAAGATFAAKRKGVFELPKNSAEAWSVGTKLYYDGSTGLLTIAAVNASSVNNLLIGRVAEPAANPSGVGRVLLSDFVGV